MSGLAAVVAVVALASPVARAEGLSKGETDRLFRGDTIARTQTLVRGGEHFVGGVTYTIVDAPADEVSALLGDVGTWKRILPRTRSARAVGTAGGDLLIELTQGTALMQATYTMRIHREGSEVRFWMDPTRSHDIEDAWGFLRASALPGGRAVVTYGVLIDLGPGLLRDMFEGRVRDLALSVPDRMRGLLLERNSAGQRAAR